MPISFRKAFSQITATACLAANLCCQPAHTADQVEQSSPCHYCGEEVEENLQARLSSARYLIDRAEKLERINQIILERCEELKEKNDKRHALMTTKLEKSPILRLCDADTGLDIDPRLRLCDAEKAPPTFKLEGSVSRKLPSNQARQQFQDVFEKYQLSRAQYLQHRQEYDEHVKEFHQQAKQDNRALPPLIVPNVKPLKVIVEDQCQQLQNLEQQLKSSEEQLLSVIQSLQSEQHKINPNVYFQQWINSQSMAMNVQSMTLSFNHGVAQKDQTSSEQLHVAAQSAMVDGDAIQANKTYMEMQRHTALANAEAQRAHLHSQLAASFLIYINALSPINQRAENTSTITADQLEKESNSLQTEYDALQEQYTSVEKLNPGRK